ncbi:hypothetical protein B4U79_16520 [Dinothrombium tinctorium]|uniref:F-box domain-containing protein n=1 Tax=Dinothrombium tinctorium TaxID=1965070 RepID=A0A443QK61_9ACAR|nr:hypothetical protein B4U79_16520 [Dinothrombium tinctorium]
MASGHPTDGERTGEGLGFAQTIDSLNRELDSLKTENERLKHELDFYRKHSFLKDAVGNKSKHLSRSSFDSSFSSAEDFNDSNLRKRMKAILKHFDFILWLSPNLYADIAINVKAWLKTCDCTLFSFKHLKIDCVQNKVKLLNDIELMPWLSEGIYDEIIDQIVQYDGRVCILNDCSQMGHTCFNTNNSVATGNIQSSCTFENETTGLFSDCYALKRMKSILKDFEKLLWFSPHIYAEIAERVKKFLKTCECSMISSHHLKVDCVHYEIKTSIKGVQLVPWLLGGSYDWIIRRSQHYEDSASNSINQCEKQTEVNEVKEFDRSFIENLFSNESKINFAGHNTLDNINFSISDMRTKMKPILDDYELILWLSPKIYTEIVQKLKGLLKACDCPSFVFKHVKMDCVSKNLHKMIKNIKILPWLSGGLYDEIIKILRDYDNYMNSSSIISEVEQLSESPSNKTKLVKTIEFCGKPKYSVNYLKLSEIKYLRQLLDSFDFADDLLYLHSDDYALLAVEIIEHQKFLNSLSQSTRYTSIKNNVEQCNDYYSLCPDDVLLKIFSFMAEKDLLSFRLVSKRMKQMSEKQLKFIPKTLLIDQSTCLLALDFQLSVYRNFVSLKFKSSKVACHQMLNKISFGAFMNILREKLHNVKKLTLSSLTSDDYVYLKSEYFQNLTSLSIDGISLVDNLLTFIGSFNRLNKLKLINIIHMRTGTFALPQSVKILKIKKCSLRVTSVQGSMQNLEKLCVESLHLDYQIWWNRICNEMINLTQLIFKNRGRIERVFLSKCMSLRRLVLHVDEIDLPESLPTLTSVQELDLNIRNANDERTSKIINCFSDLQQLTFYSNDREQLFKQTRQSLSNLTQLKSIVFNKYLKYTVGKPITLIDFFEASPSCTDYKIFVRVISREELNYIVKGFKRIARMKNRICQMHVTTHRDFKFDTIDLPENIKLTVEKELRCEFNDNRTFMHLDPDFEDYDNYDYNSESDIFDYFDNSDYSDYYDYDEYSDF